jgi:hypothetical protein
LRDKNKKVVDVDWWDGVTCGDVLRRSVAVRAHHPGGDVAVAAGRAILGETKVG